MSDPWTWPLASWSMPLVPDGDHRGAFGKVRKHDIHTGVDLYCEEGTKVFAVENGRIVSIENFTGPNADDPSPWWNDTQAILIKGESGVTLYGEMMVPGVIQEGHIVKAGELIGLTKSVLKKDTGHGLCMLHFELYKPGTVESVWWKHGFVVEWTQFVHGHPSCAPPFIAGIIPQPNKNIRHDKLSLVDKEDALRFDHYDKAVEFAKECMASQYFEYYGSDWEKHYNIGNTCKIVCMSQPDNLLDPTAKLKTAFYNLDVDGFNRRHKESYDQGYRAGHSKGNSQGYATAEYNRS